MKDEALVYVTSFLEKLIATVYSLPARLNEEM